MKPIQVLDTIKEISKEKWNQLVPDNNPFVRHEFYRSLEKGNCLKGHTGWHPLFFIKEDGENLIAALVVFVKTDSYGEFIFDWEWARAYQQYGIDYYPKLTMAVPYSPISAPKLLGDLEVHRTEILPALISFYQKENVSSIHALFTEKDEDTLFQDLDFMKRDSFQYHWKARDFKTFEDYLKALKKNKRKSIKKERRIVEKANLEISLLNGEDVSVEQIDFFYECYLTTIDKKWSQAYLTRDFFFSLFKSLPQQTHLFIVKKEGRPVASALYLSSDTTLYGRYWGCVEEIEFLHFELCIYQGIELCLEKGLSVFEAGAQGEHKRIRGFDPVITQSWHLLKREDFHMAIQKFCLQEREYIKNVFQQFELESPYKKED